MKRIRALERFGQPIVVYRMQRQDDMQLHSHEFTEIVVVTGGHGVHKTDTCQWPVSSGDVFVINRTVSHAYENTRDLEIINVLFDRHRLQLPSRELSSLPGYVGLFSLEPAWRTRHQFKSRLRLAVKDLIRTEELIDNLESELKTRAPGFLVASTAILTQLITHLSRCYSGMTNAASLSLLKIGAAISYMESNYDKPVCLEELASIAGMSQRSFQRTFREARGTSPIDYLLKKRIARAAELLRSGNFSATEAAYEVGFNDSNYFCRQFTRILGTAPGKYRRRNAL